MDSILSLLTNPTMLIVMVLLLFGGSVNIGDKTILQLLTDLLANLFKPKVAAGPDGAAGGGILDMIKGLMSNPMVLIVGVLAVMMLSGGSCDKPKPAADAADAAITWRPAVPTDLDPLPSPTWQQVDGERLALVQTGGFTEPVNREPTPIVPVAAATCRAGTCQAARPAVFPRLAAHRSRYGFWQRGPVRRGLAGIVRVFRCRR
jgi:hypothetical protein